jgi:hypothetical protein
MVLGYPFANQCSGGGRGGRLCQPRYCLPSPSGFENLTTSMSNVHILLYICWYIHILCITFREFVCIFHCFLLLENHQYVIGKVMTAEPPTGRENPNETFLQDVRRTNELPTQKQFLPITSNQEIGWFTKIKPLDSFRQDLRVNHPRHYSALSRYMDVFWSYYPPPPAKFHPKDN